MRISNTLLHLDLGSSYRLGCRFNRYYSKLHMSQLQLSSVIESLYESLLNDVDFHLTEDQYEIIQNQILSGTYVV